MNNASVFPVYGAVGRLFAAVCLGIGDAFIYVFTGSYDTWSLSVFTVFYAAMVLAYVYGRDRKPAKESWFWLAVLLAIGIQGNYLVGAVLFCLLCVFPVEDWTASYNAWARMRGMIMN